MAYGATVIPVMLASPGDVAEERRAARDVIHEWNYVWSLETNVVLMPVGWETHSAPELGGRAQELINDRVLADCDLLVGIFWTRLGTPTGDSASGTVEEIELHLNAGKPAMIYFSSQPVAPQSLDPFQYKALSEFRFWCEERGLIEKYESIEDFRAKFGRQLSIQLGKNPYLKGIIGTRDEQSTAADHSDSTYDASGDLSPIAKELLLEASQDPGGEIMKLQTLAYRYLQTNGKKLGLSEDRREFVRWEHALRQLVDAGLVISRGHRDEMFEVSEPGYQLAENLRASSK